MFLVRVNKEDIIKGLELKISEVKQTATEQYNKAKELLTEDKGKECFLNRIIEECDNEIDKLKKYKAIVENTEEHFLTLDDIINNCIFKDK